MTAIAYCSPSYLFNEIHIIQWYHTDSLQCSFVKAVNEKIISKPITSTHKIAKVVHKTT